MQARLDPSALSVHDAIKVLQAAGARHVSAEELRADIEAGAPTNPDGTLNLLHYAAWLITEMARARD